MKLNNKGFAITGILYTLFILFLLIMGGVLSSLRTRDKLLSHSLEGISEDYELVSINENKNDYYNQMISDNGGYAPFGGLYAYNIGVGSNRICYVFLKKGESMFGEMNFVNCDQSVIKDDVTVSADTFIQIDKTKIFKKDMGDIDEEG